MIKVQATIDWTEVGTILCPRNKMLSTNKKAVCAECGHTIYYNYDGVLYYPADVKKVCEVCGLTLIKEQEKK